MPPLNHIKHIIGLMFFLIVLALLIFFNDRVINLFFPNQLMVLSRQLQNQNISPNEKEQLINLYVEETENNTKLLVGVPKNRINELNQQLRNKELSLLEKEKLIFAKEQELKTRYSGIVVMGVIIFILFALLILNFYLDYRHHQNSPPSSP